MKSLFVHFSLGRWLSFSWPTSLLTHCLGYRDPFSQNFTLSLQHPRLQRSK